tara:strand:+ start:1648 stop:1971 length:324 start_codon:yes stop_codon:yes gene_type:complete
LLNNNPNKKNERIMSNSKYGEIAHSKIIPHSNGETIEEQVADTNCTVYSNVSIHDLNIIRAYLTKYGKVGGIVELFEGVWGHSFSIDVDITDAEFNVALEKCGISRD